MTTIRWKNGGPLFLQPAPGSEFGIVAADQECCCPPPPPPRCWDCLDWCSYFIEVSSPSSLAVKSPAINCGITPTTEQRVSRPYFFENAWPEGTEFYAPSGIYAQSNASFSAAGNLNNTFAYGGGRYGLAAQVGHPMNGICPVTDSGGCGVFAPAYFSSAVNIICEVLCEPGREPTPFFVIVRANVQVQMDSTFQLNNGGSGYCNGFWDWAAEATFPIDSTCSTAPQRQCQAFDGEHKIFQTPISISADQSGTTLGDYDSTRETIFGDFGNAAKAIGESIRDALSATFRITSRPSCEITDCSCGQSLAGVSLSLYGETFTVGNEPNPDRNFASGEQVWSYTDSTSNPVIDYTVWDPDQLFLEEKYKVRAELFCSGEQQANGNVGPVDKDAWYVIVYSDCFEWQGGSIVSQTRKTYVGAYECYEHCGKFLPFGTPSLMYLVSSVTTPGLDSCSPLPSTSIVISFEDCE